MFPPILAVVNGPQAAIKATAAAIVMARRLAPAMVLPPAAGSSPAASRGWGLAMPSILAGPQPSHDVLIPYPESVSGLRTRAARDRGPSDIHPGIAVGQTGAAWEVLAGGVPRGEGHRGSGQTGPPGSPCSAGGSLADGAGQPVGCSVKKTPRANSL